jgi:hypothetical protein
MQQVTHPNDPKWRAEKNREQPTEKPIDRSAGVKQIVNGFMDQAPERVCEQHQRRKRPGPIFAPR